MSDVTMLLTCPHCGRQGSTTSTLAPGDKVRCPACQQAYQFPPGSPARVDPPAPFATSKGNPLALSALVLGIVAALVCWIPFAGLLAIPSGGLGMILGIAAVSIALPGRRSGLSAASVGGGLGLVAMIAALTISWGVASAIDDGIQAANQAPLAPVANNLPLPFDPNPVPLPVPGPVPVQPAPFIPAPAPGPVRRAPAVAPPTVPMGEPFVLGDLEVRVVKLERGKVPLQFRNPGQKTNGAPASKEDLLSVSIEVKNASKGRKIDYRTMAGPLVQLTDDFGNRYKAVNFGATVIPRGRTESATIYPGKVIGDVLVFEPPVDAASEFILQIPAEKTGAKKVAFRFKIPAGSILDRAAPGPP
jgi:hypothetical protein